MSATTAVIDRARLARPSRAFGGSLAGAAGLVTLLAVTIACLATLPWTLGAVGGAPDTPAPYKFQVLEAIYLPPSWVAHDATQTERREALREAVDWPWLYAALGTDGLGRSLLYRCLAGGGVSIGIGLAAALISVVLGTAYGAAAGHFGGRTDAALMRIVDVLYGLPYILLVVLLAVAVDALAEGVAESETQRLAINVVTLLVAIGGVSWLTMARVVRGQVLSLTAQPFMEAARAVGVPTRRQMVVHLLPNLVGPIVVYGTLTAPQAILQESFLSFLGIGVQPPLPSWGNLAAAGLTELNTVRPRWWLLLFPSLLLGVTLLALNFVGEGLREALDPKRGESG